MSSSGGGIIVSVAGHPDEKVSLTKEEGQCICDALTAQGETALAAKIQPIVNQAS